jgi:hypothetical protein
MQYERTRLVPRDGQVENSGQIDGEAFGRVETETA